MYDRTPIARMEPRSAKKRAREEPILRPNQHHFLNLQQVHGNRFVQRMATNLQATDEAEASEEVEQGIRTARGGGKALDQGVRRQMEAAFNTDFGNVRIHTSPEATRLNTALSARAFTTGQDIFFRDGEYQPGSSSGRELLAHELTHVVQQTGKAHPKLLVGDPDDEFEKEAEQVASTFQGKEPPTLAATQIQHSREPAALSLRIQKQEPIEAVGLGLALFAEGMSLGTSGGFTHQANSPSYMHEHTPQEATWTPVRTRLTVFADHPRLGIGVQNFYFLLSYQHNGYDIRGASINALRSESSSMILSNFTIAWSGEAYSLPQDPVSEIRFDISGEWNPLGRGDFSFWGELIISAAKGSAPYERFSIESEERYVW